MKTTIEKLVALASATKDNVGTLRELVRTEQPELALAAKTSWHECRNATKARTVETPMLDDKGNALVGTDGKPAMKTTTVTEIAAPTGGLFHASAQLMLLETLGCVAKGKTNEAFLALAYSENASGWRQLYEPVEGPEKAKTEKPTLKSLGL
jgi:hypothetical protein